MPPMKKKLKVEIKDLRSREEITIQNILNSQYHCMTPMLNAKYVRITSPSDGLDYHYSTEDSKFFEFILGLCQKGLKDKILKDLLYFSENYDSKWSVVLTNVELYLAEHFSEV